MKKIILPVLFIAISIAVLALRNHSNLNIGLGMSPHNSGGSTPGKTGAPGEQNCTQCHSGSAQDGTLENKLMVMDDTTPITNYVPGQQYTVTLQMTSNPAKKGFQATALTGTTAMAGTFTGQSGNTNINGTIKKYANHTSTSNTSTSAPIWTWTWTAPEAGTGNVTFYVASNKSNNNGMTSGDQIYLSQHIFSEASSAEIDESSFDHHLVATWNGYTNSVNTTFHLEKNAFISLNIVDATGKSVYNKPAFKGSVGKNAIEIPSPGFSSGMYIVNLFIDNKPLSKKVIIP